MAPCSSWEGESIRRPLAIPATAPWRQRQLLFLPLVAEAWESIGNNRLRTALAMLGIVIGVASVVILLGIGTASQNRVEKAIHALGTNLLIVSGSSRVAFQDRQAFDNKDIDALSQLPLAEDVGYATGVSIQNLSASRNTIKARVIGTVPQYLPIRNWEFEEGGAFSEEDMQLGKRVVVIGRSVADQLFPSESPLGRTISIGDLQLRFEIIGVLEPKGPGLSGDDQDNVAFVPILTYKSYFNTSYEPVIQFIYIKAVSSGSLGELTELIRDTLRQRHKVPEARPDFFNVQNVNAAVQVASETTQAFSVLLGSVASISLLVGGIGIMNIMLVTVSERTREIGIRKAIGATEQQILVQFLLEAVMISGAGSAAGLVIGLAGGAATEFLLGVPVEFTLMPAALALGMSLGIGLPSGIYPAYKASRLEPIEALRMV